MVRRIQPLPKDQVWGSTDTEPWFPNPEKKRIGEVWFPTERLLLKFLFARENLSVQVHPPDDYAAQHHAGSPGKTEMWHILRAEPGAKIAAGLTRAVTRSELERAALDGSIADLLQWRPAAAGETYFIPAGTIHAIGGGVTLYEIQQKSEITYRMYDWGRGRELHLQHALQVAYAGPFEGLRELPVRSAYFQTEMAGDAVEGPAVVAVIGGEGLVGGEPVRTGDVMEVTGRVELSGVRAIVTR